MVNTFTTTVSAQPDSDYEEIINHIRSLTFDSDPLKSRIPDTILKNYIRLVIPVISFSVTFDSVNEIFDKELNETQKLEIALRASLYIMSGMPEDFSYRNPVMSARRKFNVRNITSRIQKMLDAILGGRLIASSTNEIDKLINSSELLTTAIEEASA
jgi:hypothetical protein